MAKQPRVTVLQPHPIGALKRFDGWLRQAGVRVGVVGLWEKDVPSLASVGDGLLILGGPMAATDHGQHAWLDPLDDLVADAHSIDIPILGICLGHQIVAHALGGRIQVSDPAGGEHGPVILEWLPAAADDPIMGPIAALGPAAVAMSHDDVVTQLPGGATELARTVNYPNQAFRLGSAWGVQFHPEKAPTDAYHNPKLSQSDYESLVADLTAADDQISRSGQLVAAGFAKVVRG